MKATLLATSKPVMGTLSRIPLCVVRLEILGLDAVDAGALRPKLRRPQGGSFKDVVRVNDVRSDAEGSRLEGHDPGQLGKRPLRRAVRAEARPGCEHVLRADVDKRAAQPLSFQYRKQPPGEQEVGGRVDLEAAPPVRQRQVLDLPRDRDAHVEHCAVDPAEPPDGRRDQPVDDGLVGEVPGDGLGPRTQPGEFVGHALQRRGVEVAEPEVGAKLAQMARDVATDAGCRARDDEDPPDEAVSVRPRGRLCRPGGCAGGVLPGARARACDRVRPGGHSRWPVPIDQCGGHSKGVPGGSPQGERLRLAGACAHEPDPRDEDDAYAGRELRSDRCLVPDHGRVGPPRKGTLQPGGRLRDLDDVGPVRDRSSCLADGEHDAPRLRERATDLHEQALPIGRKLARRRPVACRYGTLLKERARDRVQTLGPREDLLPGIAPDQQAPVHNQGSATRCLLRRDPGQLRAGSRERQPGDLGAENSWGQRLRIRGVGNRAECVAVEGQEM